MRIFTQNLVFESLRFDRHMLHGNAALELNFFVENKDHVSLDISLEMVPLLGTGARYVGPVCIYTICRWVVVYYF